MAIRSDAFPYDMADWVAEKSENVLKQLAGIVDVLAKADLSQAQQEELRRLLYYAIHNTAKLLSSDTNGQVTGITTGLS